MSDRYANLRKRVAEASVRRVFCRTVDDHLYAEKTFSIQFKQKLADNTIITGHHELVNNRIVPSSDIFDFVGEIKNIIRKDER